MAWRVAKSLEVLLGQINKQWPKRSKLSDGGIGNEEHQNRSSDHNAWVKDGAIGIVTARDFTHDPVNGPDSEALAEALLASKDRRIKYIISNKKIASGDNGPSQWKWRPYTGKNPHNHHVHVSVKSSKEFYDMTGFWNLIFGKSGGVPKSTASGTASPPPMPVLKKGSKGQHVEALQTLLNKHGMNTLVDGKFGPDTVKAVKLFQSRNGIVADGIVGPYTWDKLKGA